MANESLKIKETQESTYRGLSTDQKIIVIGASAGGFEAIKKIVQSLPEDFATPVFIVWHIAPGIRGVLPDVLNRLNKIPAAHAYDKEKIAANRIYVAPPDHHL